MRREFSRSRPVGPSPGLVYEPNYLAEGQLRATLDYLNVLKPIWEYRFSAANPPPAGTENRQLLRPVYWLGNWQFACLNYYHPPKGIDFRCVRAEPYPPVLREIVDNIEMLTRERVPVRDIPRDWHLNTCLINYYGSKLEGDKWNDVARVGEHKDFEPGPVASLSFGERALFQFVASKSKAHASSVIRQMWLDHNSLQIFGGDNWKKKFFHRVQRVEKIRGHDFARGIPGFKTRRINLTFRYVPEEHIQKLARFPAALRADLRGYVEELARSSDYFREELEALRASEG